MGYILVLGLLLVGAIAFTAVQVYRALIEGLNRKIGALFALGFLLIFAISVSMLVIVFRPGGQPSGNEEVKASPTFAPTNSNSNIVIEETPSPTPDKAQFYQLADAYISAKLRNEDKVEDKEGRKVVFVDLDGDMQEDVLIKYYSNPTEGNSWGINLAVFRNEAGRFRFVDDEVVGGKFFRSFKLLRIKDGEIIAETETCLNKEEPVGICDSRKSRTIYVLDGGSLKEKTPPNQIETVEKPPQKNEPEENNGNMN